MAIYDDLSYNDDLSKRKLSKYLLVVYYLLPKNAIKLLS